MTEHPSPQILACKASDVNLSRDCLESMQFGKSKNWWTLPYTQGRVSFLKLSSRWTQS